MKDIRTHLGRGLLGVGLIVLVGTQLGNGCTSDGGTYDSGGGYSGGSHSGGPYEPAPGYDPNVLPSDARLVSEGSGDIGFRAGSSGQMWLYDVRDRRVIYSTPLVDGDNVLVSTREDRVYVNGRSIAKIELSSERVHRLYFDGRRSHTQTGPRPDDRYDRDRNDRDRNDRQQYDRDRDRNTDPRPTEPARKPLVPDTAQLVAEGNRGSDASYKATANGRIYVYDNTNNLLIGSFPIRKNQRFTISPANDLATIDGRPVLQNKGISKRADYRLLFDASN